MDTRLIETAFPLKQTSLDSVHEKSMRHGHISTLHIWPARRPLAAARAALIATLLPDPGTQEARQVLLEKLGGKVVQKVKPDQIKEETVGGILHWGRESNPDLAWFREEIRKAYGGRAPRVLAKSIVSQLFQERVRDSSSQWCEACSQAWISLT